MSELAPLLFVKRTSAALSILPTRPWLTLNLTEAETMFDQTEEQELEEIVADLAYRWLCARWDSAERRFIERQVDGIKHGSELGGLIVEEYEMAGRL
jgi:hypothetical protein